MKYKIGDKVRIHNVTDHRRDYNGTVVTIRSINPNGKTSYKSNITHYGVKEKNIGFVFWEDELASVPVNTRKIVITSDGVETLARLYDGNKVIKTATAKCSPDDTFDFETGARIAFDRLIDPPLTKALRNMGETAKKCAEALKKSVASIEVKPPEYKAGDKVKVIANTCCHGMKIGEVVTLDRVYIKDGGSTPWLVKEYKNQWYIRERDFEPYKEPKKKPLKIEVGKKYLLKPYDEVEEHLGLSKETWDKIAKRYVVAEGVGYTVYGDTCYHGRWAFVPEAFEKEYIEEKPFKFEVGKQYKYDDLVIEITNADREARRYHYKVIKGNDSGNIKFFDENSIFGKHLTPYDPPKYYNGKVVCVKKNYPWAAYTVGKVYEFKDGRVVIDNGHSFPSGNFEPVKSLDEWNKDHSYYGEFIPFVE